MILGRRVGNGWRSWGTENCTVIAIANMKHSELVSGK